MEPRGRQFCYRRAYFCMSGQRAHRADDVGNVALPKINPADLRHHLQGCTTNFAEIRVLAGLSDGLRVEQHLHEPLF
jgi:hypothetical protein